VSEDSNPEPGGSRDQRGARKRGPSPSSDSRSSKSHRS
jgi:hypothetical protein